MKAILTAAIISVGLFSSMGASQAHFDGYPSWAQEAFEQN